MGIEQSHVLNLYVDDFYTFLNDPTTATWDAPDPVAAANFAKDSEHVLGVAPTPVKFSWVVQETYTISNGGQHVSSLEAVVPMVQELAISSIYVLFVQNGLEAGVAQTIRDRISTYDPTSGIDPLDWARDAIPAGTTGGFSRFDLRLRSRVQKVGAAQAVTSGRDAIITYFSRTYGEDYRLDGPTTQILRELPEPPRHPNVREVASPTSPAEVEPQIDDIAAENDPGNCDNLERWQEPVADLANYSEYMVKIELVDVIVCGQVVCRTNLPVLYDRNVVQQLWAFGRWPRDPFGVIGDIVKACARNAATAGVVVGLALFNFVAALKVFEAVFVECVEQKVTHLIECVIPGLAVMANHGPWTRSF